MNKPIKKKIEQENVEEIKEEIQKKSNPLNSCKMHSQEKIYSYCIRDQCFYCKNCIDEHQSHKIIQISPFLQQIFRFNSFLGEGSFGSVFGIQNISNNNEYAIKIIGDVETPADLDNKLREIKVLQKSNHKNIIKHYESFWIHTEQKLVILMDLAECNLTRVKKEEIWENLDYLIQLIEGLEYLHENKIIHLDFKRQNILKCKNNRLKLSDFGECRIMKQNETKIQTLNEIGTENYMAPEFRSQNSEIKIKTSADIFSLGIVIHELLTEKHPFRDMKDGKVYINEENLNIDKSLNGTHFDSLIKG